MCDFYIYELDKILKSDMDELVKIFGIVSAIATAIAAFLTFRTLKEVKTQRESMYMPDIIIEEKQFFIYGAETSKGISFCEFSIEKKKHGHLSEKFAFSKFSIDIFNIGLATAKKVEVNFTFNTEKSILNIENINKNIPLSKAVKINKTKTGIEFIGGEDSLKSGSMHFINNQLQTKINHVLPINISDTPFKVELPMFILELYTTTISQFWIDESQNREFPDFPPIKVKFTYLDIGNKKHKKKYQLYLSFNGGSNSEAWCSIKVK